jgi:hypothetical protein
LQLNFEEDALIWPFPMLLIFNSPVYEEINLSTRLAANLCSIVEDNFGLTKRVVDYLPRKLVGVHYFGWSSLAASISITVC